MKVYLAARFSRRLMLARYADDLDTMGIGCTSRWLDSHGTSDGEFTPSKLARFAQEDLDDIRACDVFVTFTEFDGVGYTSGGRHVEFGVALILGKPIIIIGPRENVFHDLTETNPLISRVMSWTEAMDALASVQEGQAA